jgi:hypothetical protein
MAVPTQDLPSVFEQHDAVAGDQERRLIGAIGDAVEIPFHPADVVPMVVEGWTERGVGSRCAVGQRPGVVGADGY